MPKRHCLMIGAGGFARSWTMHFMRPFYADRVEIVGIVDVNPAPRDEAGERLGIPPQRRFDDIGAAFDSVEADFCAIVIPPAHHEAAVMAAVEHRVPILSEKPIADTWEACERIYRAVTTAGAKMAVIQNYRFEPRILTIKQILESGRLGRINYVMGRYAEDYQERGSWAMWRHEIPHSLLIEGSVHHLDQLRNLAGGDCEKLSGWEWNPQWSSFDGECCASYLMRMDNGVICHYEGSLQCKGRQNGWHREYYRVECENGSVEVDETDTVRVYEHEFQGSLRCEHVPLVHTDFSGHQQVIHDFLDWLEGGPAPVTCLEDNIKSAACIFAAIDASAIGAVVNVADRLATLRG